MYFRPIISICIFSYNYEQYIAEAIESALSQQVNVPFEIVIGDDLSTDSTRDIILKYKEKYPHIIKLSFNKKNLGGTQNWIKTINKCRGKYIALLDGDDYFTSKNKLQHQFNVLEQDIKAVLCFHAVEEKYDDVYGIDKIVRFEKDVFTIEDFLLRGWFIRTGSTFFRNYILPKSPPDWVYDFPYRYDTIMHVFLGSAGHAIYIDENMSVWRKHTKGMGLKFSENISQNTLTEIALAGELNTHTKGKYGKVVNKYISGLYSGLFLHLLKKRIKTSEISLILKSALRMDKLKSLRRIKNSLAK